MPHDFVHGNISLHLIQLCSIDFALCASRFQAARGKKIRCSCRGINVEQGKLCATDVSKMNVSGYFPC